MLPRMSHNNLPTKSQDNTVTPQSISWADKLARALSGNVQDIRGNAKWDLLKFIYQHRWEVWTLLLLGWAAMNGLIVALLQKIRGIPFDWLIIGLLAVFSVIPFLIAFVLIRRRGRELSLNSTDIALPQDAPPLVEEKPSQLPAPSQPHKPAPNLVCLRIEHVYADRDVRGVLVHWENKMRTAKQHREHIGFPLLLAVFHNRPLPTRKIVSTGNVSAQIVYKMPGQKPPFHVARAPWFTHDASTVVFGVNESHSVVIALPEDSDLCAALMDYDASHRSQVADFERLNTKEVTAIVNLIDEAKGTIINDEEFAFHIKLEPQLSFERVINTPQGESTTSAQESERPQSMNELIRAAARDIEKVPCGAGWLHAIAENDRTQIQNAVQVRGIGLRNLMDDGIPRLEFVFSVYNKSVYPISIEFMDGYIRFSHEEKLRKSNLEMKENQVVDCPPRRSASFTLEQTLLDSEVRYITSQTDDKLFWFDELVIMIKGGSFPSGIVPQRLKIEGQVSRKVQVWRNYND